MKMWPVHSSLRMAFVVTSGPPLGLTPQHRLTRSLRHIGCCPHCCDQMLEKKKLEGARGKGLFWLTVREDIALHSEEGVVVGR